MRKTPLPVGDNPLVVAAVGVFLAVVFAPVIIGNIIGLLIVFGAIAVLGLVAIPLLAAEKAYEHVKLASCRQAGRIVGRQRARKAKREPEKSER